ncbi:MAG: CHAT domain-containing protein [Bacteroidales bacterium]|nr:CHAT domain-containing protein [Bacteroidales bacterium]MCF8404980.1 CHAT domain-containing protein [Bacteroidales bacterium]
MLKYTAAALWVFLCFIIFSIPSNLYSQEIDSLRSFKSIKADFTKSNYDSALITIWSKINKSANAKEWNVLTKSLIYASYANYMKGNIDSLKYYNQIALSTFNEYELTDNNILSEIYYLNGLYYYNHRNVDSATYFSNVTINLCDNNYDSLLVLVYKLKGNLNLFKGNYKEALSCYQKSLHIEKTLDNPSQVNMASIYQNTGIIFYNQSEFDSARYYFFESLKIKEEILSENDPKLANGLTNFGLFLLYMGEPEAALNYMNKAEEMYLRIFGHNYEGLAPIYINKGALLTLLRNYDEALNYQLLAFELYKNQLDNDPTLLSTIRLNLGILYRNLGKPEEAIEHLIKSRGVNKDPVYNLKCVRSLAECYDDLEDMEAAEQYFQNAIEIAKNLGSEKMFELAYTQLRFGVFYNKHENYNKSFEYFEQAYKILKSTFGDKNRDVASALTNISKHYNREGDYTNAISYSQQALISIIDDFNDKDISHNPKLAVLEKDFNVSTILYLKADAIYKKYKDVQDVDNLKISLQTAGLAIELFESIKSSMGMDKTKLRITEEASSIYDLAILISSELYQITNKEEYYNKCFEYAEKSKAAVLLSTIRKMEALQVGNIPDSVKALEKNLKQNITQYENLILEESQQIPLDSNKVGRIRKNLFKIRLEYDSLVSRLEQEYPEYYNLKFNLNVIDRQAIAEKLNKDQTFIEYKLVDTILYTFIITSDTSLLIKKNVGPDFNTEVGNFVGKMNILPDVDNVKKNSLEFINKGYELFLNLSLNNEVVAHSPHLIIVSDDILGYLSFDALITEKPTGENSGYRNLEYLIRKHSISYGYSGTLFFNRENNRKRGKGLLAMAPDYQANPNSLNTNNRNALDIGSKLYPLEYSQKEVLDISHIFKGEVFTGEEATEGNFKANSQNSQLLHFAMHTLVNDEDPLNSKLVFYLNGDTLEDGFLNIYEIYNLNLDAELAVLSACKTGVGKISKGEGIMSLARGFLYAGVPGIVMTLWAIEDISSAEIISAFYSNLKLGLSKDVSLQQAKLEYLNSANQLESHPYFWAAFVQIGNNSPISTPGMVSFIYYLGGGILIMVILILFWIRRRRKKLA